MSLEADLAKLILTDKAKSGGSSWRDIGATMGKPPKVAKRDAKRLAKRTRRLAWQQQNATREPVLHDEMPRGAERHPQARSQHPDRCIGLIARHPAATLLEHLTRCRYVQTAALAAEHRLARLDHRQALKIMVAAIGKRRRVAPQRITGHRQRCGGHKRFRHDRHPTARASRAREPVLQYDSRRDRDR
jgi:hypothetical protein